MELCLDVGNSQIFGGVFKNNRLIFKFRYDSQQATTSDMFGIFLKNVLRENQIKCHLIENIAICSVVPQLDYTLRAACNKYYDVEPFFLKPGAKTGLKIKYRDPTEVGADRIADAIAGAHAFSNKNLIIVNFGTATTCCVVTREKEYLGGLIMSGIRLSMNTLQNNTAQISPVEIVQPKNIIGRTTKENVQSGLYFGHLGMIKYITDTITSQYFPNHPPVIIGTGGFAYLFEDENIYTTLMPDLVLQGLHLALNMNL